ncbi:MAG: LutC/YkgG family protein [Myxococcota bacterium]
MSDDRELVLSRIRQALASLPRRTPLPQFDAELMLSNYVKAPLTRIELFGQQLERAHGRLYRQVDALVAFLRERRAFGGYVDPKLMPLLSPAFTPEFTLNSEFAREQIDDYAFGITRATGGIAETGSVILTDRATSRRLAALAPWIHVAVLYEAELFLYLGEALASLGDDPNVIFCTGPSKTADVEGILIEGVHGPGEQIALVLPSK